MNIDLQPILENDLVTLRPIQKDDFKALFRVASDPLIWEQHQNKDRHTQEAFTQFFNEALQSASAFVIIDNVTSRLIGSSRFRIIDETESVVEIGWSFLGRDYWGGIYNREMKKLMVNYALKFFEKVIFYVNPKNFRSQHALEKLGARKAVDFTRPWVLPENKGVTYVMHTVLE